MNVREAKTFIARFDKGDYSHEEYEAFLEWLKEASVEDLDVIADEHEALQESWSLSNAGPSAEWIAQLEQKLDQADDKKEQAIIRRIHTGRRFRWMTAAAVVGLLAAGAYWWNTVHVKPSDNTVEALVKSISVPRGGGQQQFELSDGSKVWLNAASTLKYPASFSGKERNVELSGEAYFEIAKNADVPFLVKIRDANIEVLGTQFNVMAYADEPVSKTTLVEGSIKVKRASEELLLHPGQQVEIAYPESGVARPMQLIGKVDQGAIVAWKKGELEFRNDDLYTVMREIARCYDVEVKYEGNIPEKRYTGDFSRKDDLSHILKQLEFQNIHFRITGKTIVVVS